MEKVTELVKDFREADAQAYIETHPFEELRYQTVFPNLYNPELTWKSLEATTGLKVAADVVAFNSRAPRKGRPMPGKKSGEIPKVEIARDKTETDFNTWRSLQNTANQIIGSVARKQITDRIIEWMYGDGVFVVDGVNARLEWISKRIASTGKYSLTQVNNEAGVTTKVDVDFGIPLANRATASVPWATVATSDPIADIEARRNAARAKGRILRYIWMEQATFDLMARSAKVQKWTASYLANAMNLQQQPTVAEVNSALARQGLPQIIIWESYVSIEGKDGTLTAESGWEPGNVTFTESNVLGDTQYTMSADEFVAMGKATKTKSGIVLVKTWAEEDPITVITKGLAYATPVLNGAQYVHILKTTA